MGSPMFRGELAFCSNFYPCKVKYEGIVYPTSEHAYQAAKSTDHLTRLEISQLATPGQAKRAGRKIKYFAEDWNDIRLRVMEKILRAKFTQNEVLGQMLLATGQMILCEENDWGDKFWGTVDGIGSNNLGKLLMKIRQELRS